MMKMFFHSGLGDLFLFHDLILDKPWKLTLTCGVLFFIAILYESIKYYRSVHCRCYMKKQQQYQVSNGNTSLAHETHAAADGLFMNRCEVAMARENNRIRALSSFLHLIQTTLAYGLMLAAMTFNVCIIFAILFGTFVGHYVFYRPYNEIESIENCH